MKSIVLFDGVCNFCNDTVNFIIRRDAGRQFMFAPLQSEPGERLRKQFEIAEEVDSVVLIEGEKAYVYSSAGLRIARRLGGIYAVAYALILIPAPIRDFFYKAFASNRYRLFGKKEVCMMPTPDVRERFLT
jgi:predicted DCC family thiol-disulfide oxidoreductase YuxK